MAPKKKPKPHVWRNSNAQRLLHEDIKTGRIPADMHWATAFNLRPEFAAVGKASAEETKEQCALRLFESRLRTARKFVTAKSTRASEELALLQQEQQMFPFPTTNRLTGEPRWEGSEAQTLLKEDVKNRVHETMTREEFYLSRPEYQQFFKRTIDGHVPQEVKSIKFLAQYRGRYGY